MSNLNKLVGKYWFCRCYSKEIIDDIISRPNVERYAWILHDKDTESVSRKLKKPHYHFLIKLVQNQRFSWFTQFESDSRDDIRRVLADSPKACFDYLIHDTPTTRAQGKYLYPESERFSTFTDSDFGVDESGEKITMPYIFDLIKDGALLKDIKRDYRDFYYGHHDRIDKYYQDVLYEKFALIYRDMNVIVITGQKGKGKTPYIMGKRFNIDDVYRSTNLNFGWIDNYAGEPVIFLDEFREGFKVSDLLDLCEGQPKQLIRGRNYNRIACHTTVVIATNWTLEKFFDYFRQIQPLSDLQDYAAFLKRVTEYWNFDIDREKPLLTGEEIKKQIFNPNFNGTLNYNRKKTYEQLTALPDEQANSMPF